VAVPSSGELSMAGIEAEIEVDNYSGLNVPPSDLSLKGLEIGNYGTINSQSTSKPDGSAEYKMSEWYGYDHDYSSWNNNTDWYSNAVSNWFNSYEKHRIDFGYATTYATNGEVADTESWSADGDIIGGATLTASTSTTTPGYINCDSVGNDCANSYTDGAIVSNWEPSGGNGTTILVWFRPHSHTNSVIWCADNGGNQRLLRIEMMSSGYVKCYAHTSSSTINKTSASTFATNSWHCMAMEIRKYQGNKGATYSVTQYVGDNTTNAMVPTTAALSTSSITTASAPWGIGCTADSATSPSNIFDGDVGLVVVLTTAFGSTQDNKLNGWYNDTKGKFGIS